MGLDLLTIEPAQQGDVGGNRGGFEFVDHRGADNAHIQDVFEAIGPLQSGGRSPFADPGGR